MYVPFRDGMSYAWYIGINGRNTPESDARYEAARDKSSDQEDPK